MLADHVSGVCANCLLFDFAQALLKPLLNHAPTSPPVALDLTRIGGFIASAQQGYPLVSMEMEKKKPGSLFIGRIVKQSTRHLVLHTINHKGYWDDEERFALADITQVAVGGGYISALAALIAHEHAEAAS